MSATRPSNGAALGAIKSAELLGTMGALVLGVGLGLALAPFAPGGASWTLLLIGAAAHSIGMWWKHRLERRAGITAWFELLYVACWTVIAALGLVLLLVSLGVVGGVPP